MSLFDIEHYQLLLLLIAFMAILYSSVGHGGASGYLAAMALFGLAPEAMRPAALTMNIFVASLVLWRLNKARFFKPQLFMPIIAGSIPAAFIGGRLTLDETSFRVVVAVFLLLAALHMLFRLPKSETTRPANKWLASVLGIFLGFIAGLTGVGGGIYLSPILLLLGWCSMRESAAIAAGFILVNSISGLAGYLSVSTALPAYIPLMVLCALAGAVVGSELAVRRASPEFLRRLLGLVLVIAGIKMLFI